MHLEINRFLTTDKSTMGTLRIDSEFECYTLEDPYHDPKIPGETRIPAGKYMIKFRTIGGFHQRYSSKFSFHEGMLEITNVKNFSYILMHIGNDPGDTEGCILVGQQAGKDFIYRSTNAYKHMYRKICAVLLMQEEVSLVIS